MDTRTKHARQLVRAQASENFYEIGLRCRNGTGRVKKTHQTWLWLDESRTSVAWPNAVVDLQRTDGGQNHGKF